MSLRIGHLSVDSRDAYEQSRWWCEVLGWSEDPDDPNLPGHQECMIHSPDGTQRLLFIEVPEAKAVKNRLHLDLVPVDRSREEEVERLVGLGAAAYEDHRRPDGTGWVTLTDPEGNELFVLRQGFGDAPDPG